MTYITLNEETIKELQKIIRTETRYKSRARAQAILLNAEGMKIPDIAKVLNISQRTLYRWFDRFNSNDLKTLNELTGRGRKPLLTIQEHAQSVKIHIKKT